MCKMEVTLVMKPPSLYNRSNSLILSNTKNIQKKSLIAAGSERILLRADLEADFKYRQLISEAEQILVTLKSSVQNIAQETPVSSPRKVCNLPTNKRVEILRHCECNVLLKDGKTKNSEIFYNKRTPYIKCDSSCSSVPNSPRLNRSLSPKKNHITKFIDQNVCTGYIPKRDLSAHVDDKMFNCAFRSPLNYMGSKEYPDKNALKYVQVKGYNVNNVNGFYETKNLMYPKQLDKNVYNICKTSNISFNAFNEVSILDYCPKSEPLKRKIYSNTNNLDVLEDNLSVNIECLEKKIMLNKINEIRRDRNMKISNSNLNMTSNVWKSIENDCKVSNNFSLKQKLIFNTIENLQKTLESQSDELNTLHCPEY